MIDIIIIFILAAAVYGLVKAAPHKTQKAREYADVAWFARAYRHTW